MPNQLFDLSECRHDHNFSIVNCKTENIVIYNIHQKQPCTNTFVKVHKVKIDKDIQNKKIFTLLKKLQIDDEKMKKEIEHSK